MTRSNARWLGICLLFLTVTGVTAQTVATQPSAYDAIISKLKSGDANVDYLALRLAYTETKDASPYGADHLERALMNAAVIEKRCGDAIRSADLLLRTFYLSPDVHAAKSACYLESGDKDKAAFHKSVYLGLMNSILASGDGSTAVTAYSVITIEEEYAVMKALGYSVWGESYERRLGHTYNVLRGTNEKAGRSATVYFNVDIPVRLEQHRSTTDQTRKQ